jgi:hypothetical protein
MKPSLGSKVLLLCSVLISARCGFFFFSIFFPLTPVFKMCNTVIPSDKPFSLSGIAVARNILVYFYLNLRAVFLEYSINF